MVTVYGCVENVDLCAGTALGAHESLRERKSGNAFIVHLLPLFLVAALLFSALLTVAANAYLLPMRAVPSLKIIHSKDNFIPKLLYWPALLSCMIAITVYVLWDVDLAKVHVSRDRLPQTQVSSTHSASPRNRYTATPEQSKAAGQRSARTKGHGSPRTNGDHVDHSLSHEDLSRRTINQITLSVHIFTRNSFRDNSSR